MAVIENRHGTGGAMAIDAAESAARTEPAAPAWRGGFGRLWSAAVVSRFGDGMRSAALPLLATSLTRSPLLVSLVTVAGFAPWLVLGLLGGALADRVDQRRAMRRGGLTARQERRRSAAQGEPDLVPSRHQLVWWSQRGRGEVD